MQRLGEASASIPPGTQNGKHGPGNRGTTIKDWSETRISFQRSVIVRRVRVAVLYSGGKDSTYALEVVRQRGWTVTHLVSIVPKDPASMLYHVPNLHVVPLLAEAMEIPLVRQVAETGEAAELDALRVALSPLEIDGVVAGAIESDYQFSRVQEVAHDLRLRAFAPLWRLDAGRLLEDYLNVGIHAIVTSVSAEGLGPEWLGRPLDRVAVGELLALHERIGLHPCGEGGEFETLVTSSAAFTQTLEIVRAAPRWEGTSGVLDILEARLVPREGDGAGPI